MTDFPDGVDWKKGVEITSKMFDKREFQEQMVKSPYFISKNKEIMLANIGASHSDPKYFFIPKSLIE